MSMHKIPLTKTEEEGLRAHGLDIGTPSQLSDAFRQGVAWGMKARIDGGIRVYVKSDIDEFTNEKYYWIDDEDDNQNATLVLDEGVSL